MHLYVSVVLCCIDYSEFSIFLQGIFSWIVKSEKGNCGHSRLQAGSLSFHDEAEDVEEEPLVRNRSRHTSSGSAGLDKDVELAEASTLPSTATVTATQDTSNPHHNGNSFPDEV